MLCKSVPIEKRKKNAYKHVLYIPLEKAGLIVLPQDQWFPPYTRDYAPTWWSQTHIVQTEIEMAYI